MKHVEEDWVDDDATRHRGPDECVLGPGVRAAAPPWAKLTAVMEPYDEGG